MMWHYQIRQRHLETSNVKPMEEMIKMLAMHPKDLHQLKPRKFEELIAELLRDMGYDVCLTPETHDHGRDIFAFLV